MALMTNCAGLSSYGMMSTRSPAISFETACTREPRMPTQAPTGSMRGSLLRTAILARTPGSRAAPRIWIRPWPTSGTSSLNSSIRNSGAVRVRNSCGPRGSERTSFRNALMRSCGFDLLARNHVGARHEAFGVAAEIDVDAVAVDALDDAADQRADAILVGVDHLRALGLAHLLHDDLLGLLRGDAAEGHRLHRLLDEAADLGLRIDLVRVLEAQLALRHLELRGVVGEHLPAAEGLVVAALAVDGDAHVPLLAVLLAGSRGQRRLERLEDHFLVDALLVGDGIDHHQDFLVHTVYLYATLEEPVSLALPISANDTGTRCPVDLERDAGLVRRQQRAGVAAAPVARRLRAPRTPASRRSARNAPACAAPGRSPARTPPACRRSGSDPRRRAAPTTSRLTRSQSASPTPLGPIDEEAQHGAAAARRVLELHELVAQPPEEGLDEGDEPLSQGGRHGRHYSETALACFATKNKGP